MMRTQEEQRIYVADLAEYNNGNLIGKWICLNGKTAEDVKEEIQEMLDSRGHEEYAIHDYEGFYKISITEYMDIDRIIEIVEMIEEHGEAFAAWTSFEPDYNTDPDKFQEEYCGEWDSEEDFTEETFYDIGYEVPEHLKYYIDFEKMSRDWFIDDYYSIESSTHKVFVFRRY